MSYSTAVSDPGSGGIAWGIDTISGTSYGRLKLVVGAEGVAVDVSDSNPMPVDDAGGTLTVDAPVGTPVFVRLSDGAAAITTLPVSAASLPLPSGAATAANQAIIAGHIDGIEALLAGGLPAALAAGGGLKVEGVAGGVAVPVSAATLPLPSGASTSARQDTANTALVAIQAAAEILDDAISGTEMQVDVVAPLPAGTNAIGKLAANSGVDIGDVDVTSVVPGTGATNLGKAVDAVAGATDTGVPTLAVRDDVLTTLTPADGDYVPLRVNSTGALHVTGGGGGTEYAVDDALGANPTGGVALAKRDDALTTLTPVEGDAVELRVDSTGALWSRIAGTVTVDGSGVTQPVSAVSLPLPSGAATSALQSVIAGHVDGIEGLLTTIDSDTSTLAGAVSGSEMQVDVVGALPTGTNSIGQVTANAGTNLNTSALALETGGNLAGAATSLALIENLVLAEDAAHVSADPGVQILAVRKATPANLSGTDGDYEPLQVADGALWTAPVPKTSGGLTTFRSIDLDETEEDVKTSAGQVYGYFFANLHATSWRYLKLYNATAASVTVGTTTPLVTIPLPPNTAGHVFTPHGIAFSTAICAAATTGVADSDTGAPGANEVVLDVFYA